MIKVILSDCAGVVINDPKPFSKVLSEKYDVPYEEILPFFKNDFQPCLTSHADLKEVITPYMHKWGWKGSVDELLNFWFESENHLNQKVIDLLQSYRSSGIKVYLHTNQEKYRTEFMKNQMGLEKIADGMFSSAYLGVKKPDPKFWEIVFSKIQPVAKEEVLVWDDDEENVASAREFGFRAELYKNFEDFAEGLKGLVKNS